MTADAPVSTNRRTSGTARSKCDSQRLTPSDHTDKGRKRATPQRMAGPPRWAGPAIRWQSFFGEPDPR
jgi:hypothetical protein